MAMARSVVLAKAAIAIATEVEAEAVKATNKKTPKKPCAELYDNKYKKSRSTHPETNQKVGR